MQNLAPALSAEFRINGATQRKDRVHETFSNKTSQQWLSVVVRQLGHYVDALAHVDGRIRVTS
jgi:hypothetical protein